MGQNYITVTVEGKPHQCLEGASYMDIAQEWQQQKKAPIVLARADGRLRELWKKAYDG